MDIKKNVAISESGFIFNPATGESFSINPIGIEIFNMVKDNRPAREIETEILDKYNIDKDTFEKDYNDFVGMLKSYSLTEDTDE